MAKSIIYKLKTPVTIGEEKIERVELQPPKGKHIKHVDPNNLTIGVVMGVAAKISGLRPAFFDEMETEDLMPITEIVGNFLGGGQEIGPN